MAWHDAVRAHPWITGIIVGGTLIGATLGFFYLNPEWQVIRRLAAGGVAGGGIGFFMTATKMLD